MLVNTFEELPDTARVWVYGVDREIDGNSQAALHSEVDAYLRDWTAHGVPLSAARDWRENRFLTIAVDQEQAGASGCSIDGLFRTLKGLEQKIGASIITSGLIFSVIEMARFAPSLVMTSASLAPAAKSTGTPKFSISRW